MKPVRRLVAVILAVGALAFYFPARLNAMFASLSDRELIDSSTLIVQAEYLGQTEVQLGPTGGDFSLGVLAVREVLKGNAQVRIVLLAMPSPTKPISSSDLLFRPGQAGVWFLRDHSAGTKGVYLADHPQRFLSSIGGKAKIDSFKALLRVQK